MTQNVSVQTPQNPQIIIARARIWARGPKWILGIIDTTVRDILLQFAGRRVVVEVLPALYVEGLLRRDMGYPAMILPARLKQTWQSLWVGRRQTKPELIVRIYVDQNNQTEKTAAQGGGRA